MPNSLRLRNPWQVLRSWLFAGAHISLPATRADELIPSRRESATGAVAVTADSALRASAVWAALRLRADLISTMPVDVFRRINGVQVEMPKPPIFAAPGGENVDFTEWLYSSQIDLDRAGNVFGLITEVNGFGLPARIELQPLSECSVLMQDGVLSYRIGGKPYSTSQVWHEKQWTVAGLPWGLSPIMYAAWTIGEYLSIQQFALDWFGNGTIPAGHLRNTAKTLSQEESKVAKLRFRDSVDNQGVFVSGNDWEYSPIQAEQASSDWIEAKKYGVTDIARFFGVPGDLIDAVMPTGTITYATITQRNLQFLIMNLQAAITRRERALSKLVPNQRYVKFNTDAILRMDPENRSQFYRNMIDARAMTPNEIRELENRPPLTESQYTEFARLFPKAPKAQSNPTADGGQQ